MARKTAKKDSTVEAAEAAAEPARSDKKAAGAASPSSAEAGAVKKPAAYVVFARRFRPNSFAEVAGQTATTSALKQALATGRLAQAYLFCGPRGVGKTSLARILAKALNCLRGKGPGGVAEEPCNDCDACRSIQEGRALDVIEMDAATNRGIEEIRSLRENVGLAPAELRYKAYIIDEVHMLTKEAWNAFLKTLEEPPPHVKFVFATTDPNNVPETILSRCQRFDLRRIGPADIVRRLKQICELENVAYDEMALSRIAGLSRGGLRDAEGLLDQAVNLGQGKITDAIVRELSGAAPDELILEMISDCAAGRTADVLRKAHQAIESGADPEDILSSLIERLRAAMLAKVCGPDTPLLEGQSHLKEAYVDVGRKLGEDQMMMLVQLFSAARRQLRDATQTRLPLEMALIRASRAGDLVELGRLVGALESQVPGREGLRGTAGPPRAGAAPPMPGGPRPNSFGRPEGIADTRLAAGPVKPGAPSAGTPHTDTATGASRPDTAAETSRLDTVVGASRPHPPLGTAQSQPTAMGPGRPHDENDVWARVVASVRALKGGVMLASGLNYAALVKLDVDAGTLALGFAAEQLLYKEPLERPEGRAAVNQALQALFQKEFQIGIERVAANSGERTIIGVEGLAPAVAAQHAPSSGGETTRGEETTAATGASRPDTVAGASRPDTVVRASRPHSPLGTAQSQLTAMGPGRPQDDDIEIECAEPEVDFSDPGELPLATSTRRGAMPAQTFRAGSGNKDAVAGGNAFAATAPVAPAAAFEKSVLAEMAEPLDIKAVEEHPLVKMVLKSSEGDIKRVTRGGGK